MARKKRESVDMTEIKRDEQCDREGKEKGKREQNSETEKLRV